MAKEKRVTIRLTQEEYEKLKEKANTLGITTSAYIRKKILGNREKVLTKCDKDLLYEINRIGNNLNQIAKHCNINKSVDKLVLQELVTIEQQLQKLLEQK